MLTKKKNAMFGRYPCCDMVNNAIRSIIEGKSDSAIEELLQAIYKADGYLHEDIVNKVYEIHNRIWDERRKTTFEISKEEEYNNDDWETKYTIECGK